MAENDARLRILPAGKDTWKFCRFGGNGGENTFLKDQDEHGTDCGVRCGRFAARGESGAVIGKELRT